MIETNSEIVKKCQQLGAIAKQALADLQQQYKNDTQLQQDMVTEAVNWADLTTLASCVVDEDGDSVWRVTVSEVAPDVWQLADIVHAGIKAYDKDGLFYPLEVVTEW